MSCCQETEKVSTKGLNRVFCSVSAFLVGGNRLVRDVLGIEVGKSEASLSKQDLDL
jgi:hypothetical protein